MEASLQLYIRGNRPRYPLDWKVGGLSRNGRNVEGKPLITSPCREFDFGRPACSLSLFPLCDIYDWSIGR